MEKRKLLLIALLFMMVNINAFSQSKPIRMKGATVEKVMDYLKKHADYNFVFEAKEIQLNRKVDINAATYQEAVKQMFAGQNENYTINDHSVIISRAKQTSNEEQTSDKQSHKIKGSVKDANGEPIIGATIRVKGTKQQNITDINGNFTIDANNNDVIQISYVGFASKDVRVKNDNNIQIQMTEDQKSLGEIVVIGYGSMKKSDLTSSISTVNSKVLSKASTTNISDALQGKVPGLDIQSERYEGENRSFYIRGTRSLNASNTPLTIVDGVPASISDVNIHDIESIEVMKDASSAAIYGSQGANGVIIITTKRGKSGKTTISYDGYISIMKPEFVKMMNGEDFVQMKRDAYLMANNKWTKGNKGDVDNSLLFTDSELEIINSGKYIDWYDLVYRNGNLNSNNVNISGGNDRTKIKVNVGYDYNKGYVKTNDTKSLYLNTSIDHRINKWASIGTSVRFKSRSNSGFATYGQALFYGTPIDRAYDSDGKIIEIPNPNEGAYNILLNYQDGQYVNDKKTEVVNMLGYLDLQFFKDLKMHTNIGYNITNERTGYFYGSNSYTSHGLNVSGRQAWHSYQLTVNNTLTYSHKFGDHNLTADFVQEIQKYEYDNLSASGEKEDVEMLTYYNLGTNSQNKNIGSGYSNWAMASVMGRIRYDYLGKYLFNASIRSDGSSRLANGNKWGSFLSAGTAWRISSEKFLKNITWLSNLKIRLSFGEVGNQSINVYQTIPTLNAYPVLFGDNGVYTYRHDNLTNNNLGWERTTTSNLGLDFGFFNNKLTGNVDLYKSKTSDLLMLRSLPTSIGYSSIYDNIGATENRGIELSLNYNIINTKDINIETYGTFSYNKNRITKLSTEEDDISNGWFVGKPISVIYDYKKIGIWQLGEETEAAKYNCIPGDIKIEDKAGTSEGITADDKTFIGQRTPKYIMSWGASIQYKNWDFTINTSGRFGHIISVDAYGYNLITSGNRWCANVNYWTPDNPSNLWPRAANDIANRYLCSYFKGDYIKFQDLTLGYDLASVINKYLSIPVTKARIYCQLRNFAYLYKAAGYNINPESTSCEITVPKCINIGVNINF
jgi:TonB-linked SusC/RagA family outer membrane protein